HVEHARSPDVPFRSEKRKNEPSRQNADDGVITRIQGYTFAHGIRSAPKHPHRKLVAEQYHRVAAGAVFVGRNGASSDGPYAQNFEKIPGRARRGYLLWIAVTRQIEYFISTGGNTGE